MTWIIDVTPALPYFVTMLYLNHSANVPCLAGCRTPADTPISAAPALKEISQFLKFQNGSGRMNSLLYYITMAIRLAGLVWPIWWVSGCSAWGEIMMGCRGKITKVRTNNAKVCLPKSCTVLSRWNNYLINSATRGACYTVVNLKFKD